MVFGGQRSVTKAPSESRGFRFCSTSRIGPECPPFVKRVDRPPGGKNQLVVSSVGHGQTPTNRPLSWLVLVVVLGRKLVALSDCNLMSTDFAPIDSGPRCWNARVVQLVERRVRRRSEQLAVLVKCHCWFPFRLICCVALQWRRASLSDSC